MVPLLPALSVVVLSALLPHGPRDALAREDAAQRMVELKCAACVATAGAAAPAPLRDDELPWCVSADDPRCAPLHSDPARLGSDTSIAFTASQPGAQSVAPQPRRPAAWTARSGLAPRPGVSARVERPPRAVTRSV
jgi:hypothetical protein